MKKVLIALFIFVSLQLTAQTDGISYQAVIIGPDNQELPGVDAEGNILPNATIAIRFTILDESNQVEYQEVQTTNTDQYGRINLLIGQEDPDGFAEISWDGTNKDLNVEIDFDGGTNYVDMAREKLTFLPYAFHRNITATGTLTVDDLTFLNGELQVEGPANLNSTLNVNGGNATNLSGDLTVEGNTNLNNDLLIIGDLEVVGATVLNDSLNVVGQATTNLSGDVNIGGNLNVEGNSDFDALTGNTLLIYNETTLAGETTIADDTNINAQLTINATIENEGQQSNFDLYPLQVEGSYQGIAIKVKDERGIANNYISFWDEDEAQMWGRIEGITIDELHDDPEFQWEQGFKITDAAITYVELLIFIAEFGESGLDLATELTAFAACAGLGACVVSPAPTKIGEKIFNVVVKIANAAAAVGSSVLSYAELVAFEVFSEENIGVSYQSGAGDYAEWLPKENINAHFSAGELVGIKNGLVTKNIWGAEKIMVVSTRPIVLGNMPQKSNEKNNVKIAFIGQVPVKVLGSVSPGDFILPNILDNRYGTAVNPKEMKALDYKRMVGVAWNIIGVSEGINIVNVAVGINTNNLSDIVSQQETEIKALNEELINLKTRAFNSNRILSNLVPGYAEAIGNTKSEGIVKVEEKQENQYDNNIKDNIAYGDEEDVIYFKITREQIETAITMAREQYVQMLEDKDRLSKLFLGNNKNSKEELNEIPLLPIEDHPFWKKIDNDQAYKNEIINFIQSNTLKDYHTHKKYAHNFTELKVRKN
ncbi:MAG: hypothetical protein V7719_16955 [Psychroserpens sp.]|uniref:hypothetical protein n=1 Tax=Psychroserpens sp. TaxID=2020870 RepID=UPI0030031111